MTSIFWGRWLNFKKSFKVYGLMFILPIIFFLAFGSGNGESRIPVLVTDEAKSSFSKKLLDELNELSGYSINLVDRKLLNQMISEGKGEIGLIIEQEPTTLKMVKLKDSVTIASFEGNLRTLVQKLKYQEKLTVEIEVILENLTGASEGTIIADAVKEKLDRPAPVSVIELDDNQNNFHFDNKLHVMLGFILFFTIYTIMFSVSEIMKDKKHGVWDRFIISPLTKVELYVGNFLFSFSISLAQMILLILLSKYLFAVTWGSNLLAVLFIITLYIFSIMSIGMFLVAISNNIQQLNAIVPIFAVSSAMLGGAFWPLEIVTSKALIFLSKLTPITYAMAAIKEVIWYQANWYDILYPCFILVLIGIVFIFAGMQLMERKSN